MADKFFDQYTPNTEVPTSQPVEVKAKGGKGFFDQYTPNVEVKAEHKAKPEKPTSCNDLRGECTACGALSDSVLFGMCEECAEIE